MIKAAQEWGFTDRPDFVRICRELAETGCALGVVESKGQGAVTLVNYDARIWPQAALQKGDGIPVVNRGARGFTITGARGRWYAHRGDLVKDFLGVIPVTVRGYR